MIDNNKQLLVVDDSEIDREVLKTILADDFDIIEAENGYEALEIIMKKRARVDAILLDVSMPVLDGFSVLQFLRENRVDDIPVFLISAEATKDNVQRAARYNISEFIGKPFEREEILKRLRSKLGVMAKHNLTQQDVMEIRRYISDLDALYNRYFLNTNEDNGHYLRMENLMKILLERFSLQDHGIELEQDQIDIISKAAYFCDIGNMLIPNTVGFRPAKQEETGNDNYQSHTLLGADLIRLNYSKNSEYFVHICADMCEHHHERLDGGGFPHRISGSNFSVYTQMCRLAEEFDNLFFKYREHNEMQFEYVINELMQDKGLVNEAVFSLLAESKFQIVIYYRENVSQ